MSSVPAPTCDHCPAPPEWITGHGRFCEEHPPHRFLPAGLAWAALGWWLSRRIDAAFAEVTVG